ncbi:proteinase-activated receptor 1 isoform X2 [Lepisosteus oculatus]|uniref:proteinase-activated receptor 1 isoform X2 n=1 Tax=Lepisosteus oculatus TaxID=7918 RepID=UPI00073FC2ED|nr:PREDICTED: proteinase-activated receptor 1-like [Lepisosteus oculatus]
MGLKALVLFSFFTLFMAHSACSEGHNGSIARGFSLVDLKATYEPIDFTYLDVNGGDGSGSGFEEPEKDIHPHTRSHKKLSQEATRFLTGPLMTVFIPTVYTLVFIISCPLNAIAVIMFILKIRPKKPAVIYMLNLAVADLLFVLLLPFKISYHFNGNNWGYGPTMCRIVTSAFYCNMYCSILLMMCISVDRLLAVVYPMKSLTWRSQQNALVVSLAMWLLAIGGVMPILLSDQTAVLPQLGITTCHDVLEIEKFTGYYLYFFPIFCSIFFFIPLIFIIVCYIRIIQCLRSANVANRSKKTRAIFMAITVFAVFVICFTPTNIILLIHYVQFATGYSDKSYMAYLLSMCIGSVSCCLDPMIYYFGSSQCQKQVISLLQCRSNQEMTSNTQSESSSKMETFQSRLNSQYKKLTA